MWCFADTKTAPGFTVRLNYPALTPGSFDWKVPTHWGPPLLTRSQGRNTSE